eukprot:UN15215
MLKKLSLNHLGERLKKLSEVSKNDDDEQKRKKEEEIP